MRIVDPRPMVILASVLSLYMISTRVISEELPIGSPNARQEHDRWEVKTGFLSSVEGFSDRKVPSASLLSIGYEVEALKQPDKRSCWATVYAMMLSWKSGRHISISSAVDSLGHPYKKYFRRKTGLPGGSERKFVEVAGLRALPPASYSLSFFKNLLADRGPIWIITGNGINSHARLIIGIYGDSIEEDSLAYRSTVFELIDPMFGSYHYVPALTFMMEYEQEAAFIVNNRPIDVDLRWQIITF